MRELAAMRKPWEVRARRKPLKKWQDSRITVMVRPTEGQAGDRFAHMAAYPGDGAGCLGGSSATTVEGLSSVQL